MTQPFSGLSPASPSSLLLDKKQLFGLGGGVMTVPFPVGMWLLFSGPMLPSSPASPLQNQLQALSPAFPCMGTPRFDVGLSVHATADIVPWSPRPHPASRLLGHSGLAAILVTLTSAIFQTGMIKPFLWNSVRITEGNAYL